MLRNVCISSAFSAHILYRIAQATSEDGDSSAIELDSHADSPVVGKNSFILRRTGKQVNVSGFTDRLGSAIPVDVVDAAVAYDCNYTGNTYIMIIRNALYLREMRVNLIPPFMMRLAEIDVDECPKFLARKPTINNHSIYFSKEDLRLPLQLYGIISYLPTRLPTEEDFDNAQLELELTPKVNEWNPHDYIYQEQEDSMLNFQGELKESPQRRFIISSVISRALDPVASVEDMKMKCNSIHKAYAIKTANGATSTIKAKDLSKLWNIGLETAKRTLQVTTRLCPRSGENITLNRRYEYNDRMLRYKHLPVNVFTDTMFASKRAGKSFRNYTCVQVYASEFGWVRADLMKSEAEIHLSVKSMFKDVGVPKKLIADGAKAQISGKSRDICNMSGCKVVELEKSTPFANRAERYIQILKNGCKTDMVRADSPMILWDYCIERRVLIENASAKDNYLLKGSVPHSMMTGEMTDISNLCNFNWYEWVKFRKPGEQFPYPTEWLGRCLGPSNSQGNAMSQNVLTESGEVLPVQTLRKLTPAEVSSPTEIEKRNKMDSVIRKRFGDSKNVPDNWVKRRRKPGDPIQHNDPNFIDESEESNSQPTNMFYEDDTTGEAHEQPDVDSIPDLDLFLNAEVLLPQDGDHMKAARVISRATDDDGAVIGEYNSNPALNTRVYDVMFPDGSIQQYAANIIAENIYSQVDDDGHRYILLDEIVDYKKDDTAIAKDDAYTTDKYGRKSRRLTTKGWSFLVNWKDGSQSWVPLKDIKESNPIEVAEFVTAKDIANEPAFIWWVPYTLRKRERIVSAVESRLKVKTHKFGVEVPRSVEHAYSLDERNNNTYWRDAIKKEMTNVSVAFDFLDDDEKLPVHFKRLGVHLIFDVKMDMTRKARLVADGHKTEDPISGTFAGVVSRETVRLAFTYAALNGLSAMAADIRNAYLTAPTSESFYIVCGPEFGSELMGKRAIVRRALYGTKSAGKEFRSHLRDCMDHLGYFPCKADPDLWIRKAKKDSGEFYYEYMLLYVDDCLCVSEHPQEALNEVNKYFPFKPSSIGPPRIYLGAKMSQVSLPNGVKAWALSASQYVQEAIKNVELYLQRKGMALRRGTKSPMTTNYRPECDISPELKPEDASYYQSLIGVLRWMVEMGRLDICCEVSMMSSHVAMPREGHLQQLFHMFSYLKAHHNARIVLDPTYPDIDATAFEKRNWKEFYGETREKLPPDAPTPLGKELLIRAFVDADHAGDKITRRSRSGLIIMANMAPIHWISKKQSCIETSSFGSEFCAMKLCCEYLKGLRYKLRMMGIPVNNPCFIYGDNQSVLWNTSVPESTLKKKSSSVAYHFVREGVSCDMWRTAYVNTKTNPADLMTKMLPSGLNRYRKVRMIMYDIYPEGE